MSPPAVLESFLGDHSETLSQPVHGVDRPGVVVDAALALPAVPVLAEPIKVEVEGTRRLQYKTLMPTQKTGDWPTTFVRDLKASTARSENEIGAVPGGTPRTFWLPV